MYWLIFYYPISLTFLEIANRIIYNTPLERVKKLNCHWKYTFWVWFVDMVIDFMGVKMNDNYNYWSKSELSYEKASEKLMEKLLLENPKRIIRSGYPQQQLHTDETVSNICNILTQKGKCNVIKLHNCFHSYKAYMKIAKYPKTYYQDTLFEKSYEHFWCLQLLAPYVSGKYIDIASEHSPLSDIAMKLYGSNWFSQDIMYKEGIHGNRIGCDATSIPFKDESVDGMCATCSIEHFEGDADTLFLLEAERILRIGGKLVIAPLYLAQIPFTITDPINSVDNVNFDKIGEICFIPNWGNRHGRWYSPETLLERLITPAKNMKFTVAVIDNEKDIHKSIYCKFILIGEKKANKNVIGKF